MTWGLPVPGLRTEFELVSRAADRSPAGANVARECNVYFLGAQTAKILEVGRATKGETKRRRKSSQSGERFGYL